MSRPSTASTRNYESQEVLHISRPTTASGGRRHLSSSSLETSGSSGVFIDKSSNISQEILNRETDQDSLLRIMNYNNIQMENEALIIVSETGDLHRFKQLLENGLNVSACRGLHGYSLLHHAAQKGHNAIIAELLRTQKIPVDVENHARETPLHLAAYAGQILTVDQLLDFGADINAVNEDSETCLFYAVRKNYPAIIRLLIQRGIDIDHCDRFGDRAIDHSSNPLTLKALESRQQPSSYQQNLSRGERLTADNILSIFSYLTLNELLRCACVNSKWHRTSEHPTIWKTRGIRKWELALQNSLGFGRTASSSFLKPPTRRSLSGSNSAKFKQSQSSKELKEKEPSKDFL